MKVDPKQPTFGNFGGMPIRLAIAARLLAGIIGANDANDIIGSTDQMSEIALRLADNLIAEHNGTIPKTHEDIEKMAKLHLQTGSPDSYGLGMYNGMMLAISVLTGEDAKYISLEQLFLERMKP